jgi:hypothetical protein
VVRQARELAEALIRRVDGEARRAT